MIWSDFNFDLRQPLLLHSPRTAHKLHARSIRTSPGQQPEEFGPPLAVPEDYNGEFLHQTLAVPEDYIGEF